MRPDFVTHEDISRWSDEIDSEEGLPQVLASNPVIREVCYAGKWLSEQLFKLGCPEEFITRIQYTAGKASFGRDPWEVHQVMLDGYTNNELDYEVDEANLS